MATANVVAIRHDTNITPARKRKRSQQRHEAEAVIKVENEPKTSFTNAAFSSTPKKVVVKKKLSFSSNQLNMGICPDDCNTTTRNPYEVLRKPPKKKKRLEDEEVCFENQALNLDFPEKKFNPYEVVRTAKPLRDTNCFTNAALNLKIQDNSILGNPFEIPRSIKQGKETDNNCDESCKLKIALPFPPTTSYRIDFQNVSLSQLTPSKLLAEKLVFSPILPNRRCLDVIREESSTDIGKELDCYQLELENSINEAKLRRNNITKTPNKKLDHEQDTKGEIKDILKDINDHKNPFLYDENTKLEIKNNSPSVAALNETETETETETELSYIEPTPFVRNYRKPEKLTLTVSKESKERGDKNNEEHNKKLTNILRKSIRKLIPQGQSTETNKKPPHGDNDRDGGLINTIRQSLRRKKFVQPEKDKITCNAVDASIVDTSERVMKLKTNFCNTDYAKIEELTNERKLTLRSSLKRSSREVTQQFMKTVFHKKKEEYEFRK